MPQSGASAADAPIVSRGASGGLSGGAPWSADPLAGAGFLTSDIEGIGGRLRDEPEDFLVDEQPLYQPRGEGEHIYLLVQKRDMTTLQAAAALARHFGVRPSDIGYAGLKDRRALTRQVFSVHAPGKKPEDFPELRHDRMSVLWTDLHVNKLRVGHLKGNRFSIKVRGVSPTGALRAARALDRLARSGAPNLAGEQRFGSRAANHLLGMHDLLGDAKALLDTLLGPAPGDPPARSGATDAYTRGDSAEALSRTNPELRIERRALDALARGATHEQAAASIDHTQRRFWLSAFQSAVFNRVLAGRLLAGSFDRLLEGDLAWKHDNGAVFRVDGAALAEGALPGRLTRLEISPSGPLWGVKMTRAEGIVGEMEEAALAETGVTLDALARLAERMRQPVLGARRPLRVPVIDPQVEGGVDERGAYVRCAFELPAGAFATVVLREVMKSVPGAEPGVPRHAVSE